MNAFHALLLGVKMLPAYAAISYEEFFESFKDMGEAQKETLLREAVAFVELSEEEVEAILSFCCDANGVPYSAVNIKNLNPGAIHECIVAVCMEMGKIRVEIVSAEEKKSFRNGQSISEAHI
jgi:uncharacterized metal-binding protein